MSEEFKIESDVPIPGRNNGKGLKYPFGKLNPGDSFLAPKSDGASAQACSLSYARRHKIKFTTRKQADGSVRIWRTK